MHLSKIASVLIITIICLFMIACPAASLLRLSFSGTPSRSDYEKPGKTRISNDYKPFLQTSTSPFSSLDKRDGARDFTLVFFEFGNLFMLIQEAAEIFERFYTGIAHHSIGEWASFTPRIWIRITIGTLRLVMSATEGTTIPWNFVAYFAVEMLKLTERGYTGMYTATFLSPTMGNAISVGLYHCITGRFSDTTAGTAPARVESCLNPLAPAFLSSMGTPKR